MIGIQLTPLIAPTLCHLPPECVLPSRAHHQNWVCPAPSHLQHVSLLRSKLLLRHAGLLLELLRGHACHLILGIGPVVW